MSTNVTFLKITCQRCCWLHKPHRELFVLHILYLQTRQSHYLMVSWWGICYAKCNSCLPSFPKPTLLNMCVRMCVSIVGICAVLYFRLPPSNRLVNTWFCYYWYRFVCICIWFYSGSFTMANIFYVWTPREDYLYCVHENMNRKWLAHPDTIHHMPNCIHNYNSGYRTLLLLWRVFECIWHAFACFSSPDYQVRRSIRSHPALQKLHPHNLILCR